MKNEEVVKIESTENDSIEFGIHLIRKYLLKSMNMHVAFSVDKTLVLMIILKSEIEEYWDRSLTIKDVSSKFEQAMCEYYAEVRVFCPYLQSYVIANINCQRILGMKYEHKSLTMNLDSFLIMEKGVLINLIPHSSSERHSSTPIVVYMLKLDEQMKIKQLQLPKQKELKSIFRKHLHATIENETDGLICQLSMTCDDVTVSRLIHHMVVIDCGSCLSGSLMHPCNPSFSEGLEGVFQRLSSNTTLFWSKSKIDAYNQLDMYIQSMAKSICEMIERSSNLQSKVRELTTISSISNL
eukprot:CAMPEP_0117421028 /NCGR_PEP_ID=MMETSP0758-20121206/2227_1 /TAXON_ID=63605 /ORGANISM="Percolomonas cosmopolitus, Strain AE-1 (ATCC 50343)" /LENGTH=295 /DNA_ID=CAMNT_0005202957 /DNA_START=9 /DNA_END=892 /DNA_ORIENTATION=-